MNPAIVSGKPRFVCTIRQKQIWVVLVYKNRVFLFVKRTVFQHVMQIWIFFIDLFSKANR